MSSEASSVLIEGAGLIGQWAQGGALGMEEEEEEEEAGAAAAAAAPAAAREKRETPERVGKRSPWPQSSQT